MNAGNWPSDDPAFGESWLVLIRALVHANVIISFAATGVGVTSVVVLDLPLELLPLGFVFSATLLAYTLNRRWDREEDAANLPGRTAFFATYGSRIMVLAGLAYVAVAAAIGVFRPRVLPVALAPIVAVWVYSAVGFKRIFLLKNVFVGLVWATIPVALAMYYGHGFSRAAVLLAAVIAVSLTVAAALFDIKDINGDRAAGITTLPTAVGPRRTRQIASIGLLVMLPIIATGVLVETRRFAILSIYVIYLAPCIPFATTDRGPLFYGLVVDGEHILVGVLALLWWTL